MVSSSVVVFVPVVSCASFGMVSVSVRKVGVVWLVMVVVMLVGWLT